MNKTAIGILVALVILVGLFFVLKSTSKNNQNVAAVNQFQNSSTSDTSNHASSTPQGQSFTVTYTDNGYSPKSLTIKAGDTVNFVNQSSRQMWTASDVHPDHTLYSGIPRTQHCPDTSGTAFDECNTGNQYSFTFQKVGTWGYHNHINPTDKGQIIVQ